MANTEHGGSGDDLHQVRHHGRTTAYRRSDRGEPTVLCVHGSGGTRDVWSSQSRLAADVVALDLSGHGESEDVTADPGYETLSAYADDTLAVARETGARVLVGNSLGGAVAMTLALERDYPLDGLVLVGTGAKLAVLDDLLQWLEGDFDRAVEFLHGRDRLFHDPDERYLAVSRDAMQETGRAVTRRDFLTSHAFDVRDDLDRIDVPAVAVVGAHDQLTPVWYHEYLADEMPDCTVEVIDHAAHLVMLERPSAFNAAVETFVERIS